ncbi:DUF948 domain-containing protein [Streptomonospora nanhaiensis]|uniref:Uncharacterized protein YoxC n=1 Tax=Streptomonospora nanhaiensis TaxID=1323731 RepID=A0A853BV03_9ACTN|nr:DUF948 domain-containing protein [Streptomonospora nanhaiensis]MBV2364880.1 DUF948 domain-containing protein [Streptomonospora nanhaiensis]MBX9387153.1 DUF948 domain-containing protein [Streptomonospora nanhaiensis]NYI98824.1 uncharacterized protein YoxC [Streptomonospora nanhaiensis]
MLTAGEVAALIAAVVWTVLVAFMCVALVKLTRLLSETTKVVAEFGERARPMLDDLAGTVERTGASLDRVEEITANLATTTEDVSTVTALTRSVVTGPLVKVASFSYGVRRVLGQRRALALVRGRRRRRERR